MGMESKIPNCPSIANMKNSLYGESFAISKLWQDEWDKMPEHLKSGYMQILKQRYANTSDETITQLYHLKNSPNWVKKELTEDWMVVEYTDGSKCIEQKND